MHLDIPVFPNPLIQIKCIHMADLQHKFKSFHYAQTHSSYPTDLPMVQMQIQPDKGTKSYHASITCHNL